MSQQLDDKIRFIKRAFGGIDLGRDGRNVAVACPKCKTSVKKKLAIKLDNDQVNCWVCHLRGRLVSVLKTYKSGGLVREYLEKFGKHDIHLLVDDTEKKPVQVPQDFKLLAAHLDARDPAVKSAIRYVKSRGLTERDMWYYRLGVSTDPELFRRVVMLSFDANGELNFYTGRAIDPESWRKYMNSDAEKKSVVFNEINIDWTKELTLVEGPFDLTKCDENAVPLLGCSLSEDSLLFGRIYQNKTPIVLALDKDMEQREWQRLAKMLHYYDIPVRIIDLCEFKDVGEMSRRQFLQAKAAAIPWDRTLALRKKINTLGKLNRL